MTRGLVRSVAWILGGAVLGAALFWAFLHTPESNVSMLALSALLVLAIGCVAGATTILALTGWASGWQPASVRGVVRGMPGFLAAVMVSAAAWWAVGAGQAWLAGKSGEIGAWFIATVNWSDARPLLEGLRLAGDWVRTIVVPFAALTWLAHVVTSGWRPLVDRSVLRQALSPWRLALVTALAAVTVWAPIAYGTYWRPPYTTVPPTWVEPAVAIAKFSLIALVCALGLSLIARLAVSAPPSSSSPR